MVVDAVEVGVDTVSAGRLERLLTAENMPRRLRQWREEEGSNQTYDCAANQSFAVVRWHLRAEVIRLRSRWWVRGVCTGDKIRNQIVAMIVAQKNCG